MVIGKMRYQIIIEKVTITTDSYGADTSTWSTFLKLKASKNDSVGTETVNNDEIFNTNMIVFETHYRNTIDIDTMRISWKNDYYKILNIVEVGYRSSMKIKCEKIND